MPTLEEFSNNIIRIAGSRKKSFPESEFDITISLMDDLGKKTPAGNYPPKGLTKKLQNLLLSYPATKTIEVLLRRDGRTQDPYIHVINDEMPVERQEKSLGSLGEMEAMVDKKVAELQKQKEFEELKEEVEELREENEILVQQNEELSKSIARKESLSYVAKIAGDLLEGFGVKKERVKGLLGNFLKLDEEPKEITDGEQTDDPVDPNASKRISIVESISNFLISETTDEELVKITEILFAFRNDKVKIDQVHSIIQ